MRDALFPLPPPASLWIPPALGGILYIGLALLRFGAGLPFVLVHLYILALWILATFLVFLAVRKTLENNILWPVRGIPALIPALSFYFLFLLYLSAAVGNWCWGDTPTYLIVGRFLSRFFQVAGDFSISPWIPLSLAAFSFIGFVAFYQARAAALDRWVKERFENFNRNRAPKMTSLVILCLVWTASLVLFCRANPEQALGGGLLQDPIRGFFTVEKTKFPMDPERLRWAALDKQAEMETRPRIPKVHNIILVIVDALRADQLPAYGRARSTTPFLGSFLTSTRTRKIGWCLANGSESAVGIMSILTSKPVPEISSQNYTLADFLADNGFQDFLYLSGDHHWYNFDNSYGHKISTCLDGTAFPPGYSIDDDEALPALLEGLKPDDGKFHFFYFHLMSVHQAGRFHDQYQQYQPIGETHEKGSSPALKAQYAVNLYDDRILQADSVLKNLFGILGRKGYLKDYLVVLTADHGELLGEDGHYGHGHYTTPCILHTPLFFSGSSPLPAFTQPLFATELDIAPTVAELAGLTPPPTWAGQSLLKPRTDPWSYHFTPSFQPGDQGAVVFYDGKKLLEYSRPLANQTLLPSNEKLVNLLQDPAGLTNLIPAAPTTLLSEFRRRALDHFSTQ